MEASDSGYTSSETGDCYDYEEPPPPEFTTSESDGSNSEYGSPSDFLDEGGDDSESSDSDEQEQEALKKQYSAQLMALRNRGYKSTWRNLTLLVREGGDAERVAAILEAENQRELQLEREYRLQQLRTQSGYLYRRTAKYGLKKWRPYFFVLEDHILAIYADDTKSKLVTHIKLADKPDEPNPAASWIKVFVEEFSMQLFAQEGRQGYTFSVTVETTLAAQSPPDAATSAPTEQQPTSRNSLTLVLEAATPEERKVWVDALCSFSPKGPTRHGRWSSAYIPSDSVAGNPAKPLMEGYMYRCTTILKMKKWKRRYFVLSGTELEMYLDERKGKVLDTIELHRDAKSLSLELIISHGLHQSSFSRLQTLHSSEDSSGGFVFHLTPDPYIDRVLELKVSSEQLMQKWMLHFNKGVDPQMIAKQEAAWRAEKSVRLIDSAHRPSASLLSQGEFEPYNCDPASTLHELFTLAYHSNPNRYTEHLYRSSCDLVDWYLRRVSSGERVDSKPAPGLAPAIMKSSPDGGPAAESEDLLQDRPSMEMQTPYSVCRSTKDLQLAIQCELIRLRNLYSLLHPSTAEKLPTEGVESPADVVAPITQKRTPKPLMCKCILDHNECLLKVLRSYLDHDLETVLSQLWCAALELDTGRRLLDISQTGHHMESGANATAVSRYFGDAVADFVESCTYRTRAHFSTAVAHVELHSTYVAIIHWLTELNQWSEAGLLHKCRYICSFNAQILPNAWSLVSAGASFPASSSSPSSSVPMTSDQESSLFETQHPAGAASEGPETPTEPAGDLAGEAWKKKDAVFHINVIAADKRTHTVSKTAAQFHALHSELTAYLKQHNVPLELQPVPPTQLSTGKFGRRNIFPVLTEGNLMNRRAQLHAFVSHLTEKAQWQRILSLPDLRALALDFFEARVMPRGRYSVLQSELIHLLAQHYMYTRSMVIPFSMSTPDRRGTPPTAEQDHRDYRGDPLVPEFRPYFPQPLLSVIFDTVVGEPVPMVQEGVIADLHPELKALSTPATNRAQIVDSDSGEKKKKKKAVKSNKKAAKKQERKKRKKNDREIEGGDSSGASGCKKPADRDSGVAPGHKAVDDAFRAELGAIGIDGGWSLLRETLRQEYSKPHPLLGTSGGDPSVGSGHPNSSDGPRAVVRQARNRTASSPSLSASDEADSDDGVGPPSQDDDESDDSDDDLEAIRRRQSELRKQSSAKVSQSQPASPMPAKTVMSLIKRSHLMGALMAGIFASEPSLTIRHLETLTHLLIKQPLNMDTLLHEQDDWIFCLLPTMFATMPISFGLGGLDADWTASHPSYQPMLTTSSVSAFNEIGQLAGKGWLSPNLQTHALADRSTGSTDQAQEHRSRAASAVVITSGGPLSRESYGILSLPSSTSQHTVSSDGQTITRCHSVSDQTSPTPSSTSPRVVGTLDLDRLEHEQRTIFQLSVNLLVMRLHYSVMKSGDPEQALDLVRHAVHTIGAHPVASLPLTSLAETALANSTGVNLSLPVPSHCGVSAIDWSSIGAAANASASHHLTPTHRSPCISPQSRGSAYQFLIEVEVKDLDGVLWKQLSDTHGLVISKVSPESSLSRTRALPGDVLVAMAAIDQQNPSKNVSPNWVDLRYVTPATVSALLKQLGGPLRLQLQRQSGSAAFACCDGAGIIVASAYQALLSRMSLPRRDGPLPSSSVSETLAPEAEPSPGTSSSSPHLPDFTLGPSLLHVDYEWGSNPCVGAWSLDNIRLIRGILDSLLTKIASTSATFRYDHMNVAWSNLFSVLEAYQELVYHRIPHPDHMGPVLGIQTRNPAEPTRLAPVPSRSSIRKHRSPGLTPRRQTDEERPRHRPTDSRGKGSLSLSTTPLASPVSPVMPYSVPLLDFGLASTTPLLPSSMSVFATASLIDGSMFVNLHQQAMQMSDVSMASLVGGVGQQSLLHPPHLDASSLGEDEISRNRQTVLGFMSSEGADRKEAELQMKPSSGVPGASIQREGSLSEAPSPERIFGESPNPSSATATIVKAGYLFRRRSSAVRKTSWRQLYFVVTQNGDLRWWNSSRPDEKLQGELSVQGCRVVSFVSKVWEDEGRAGRTFMIAFGNLKKPPRGSKSQPQFLYLEAESDKERYEWLDALSSVGAVDAGLATNKQGLVDNSSRALRGAVVMEGWLTKRFHNTFGLLSDPWHRRWYVLLETGRMLCYGTKPTDAGSGSAPQEARLFDKLSAKGAKVVSFTKKVYEDENRRGKTFAITSKRKKRTWVLECESESQLYEWLEKLSDIGARDKGVREKRPKLSTQKTPSSLDPLLRSDTNSLPDEELLMWFGGAVHHAGWMYKRTEGGLRTSWRRRFVILRGTEVRYYAESEIHALYQALNRLVQCASSSAPGPGGSGKDDSDKTEVGDGQRSLVGFLKPVKTFHIDRAKIVSFTQQVFEDEGRHGRTFGLTLEQPFKGKRRTVYFEASSERERFEWISAMTHPEPVRQVDDWDSEAGASAALEGAVDCGLSMSRDPTEAVDMNLDVPGQQPATAEVKEEEPVQLSETAEQRQLRQQRKLEMDRLAKRERRLQNRGTVIVTESIMTKVVDLMSAVRVLDIETHEDVLSALDADEAQRVRSHKGLGISVLSYFQDAIRCWQMVTRKQRQIAKNSGSHLIRSPALSPSLSPLLSTGSGRGRHSGLHSPLLSHSSGTPKLQHYRNRMGSSSSGDHHAPSGKGPTLQRPRADTMATDSRSPRSRKPSGGDGSGGEWLPKRSPSLAKSRTVQDLTGNSGGCSVPEQGHGGNELRLASSTSTSSLHSEAEAVLAQELEGQQGLLELFRTGRPDGVSWEMADALSQFLVLNRNRIGVDTTGEAESEAAKQKERGARLAQRRQNAALEKDAEAAENTSQWAEDLEDAKQGIVVWKIPHKGLRPRKIEVKVCRLPPKAERKDALEGFNGSVEQTEAEYSLSWITKSGRSAKHMFIWDAQLFAGQNHGLFATKKSMVKKINMAFTEALSFTIMNGARSLDLVCTQQSDYDLIIRVLQRLIVEARTLQMERSGSDTLVSSLPLDGEEQSENGEGGTAKDAEQTTRSSRWWNKVRGRVLGKS